MITILLYDMDKVNKLLFCKYLYFFFLNYVKYILCKEKILGIFEIILVGDLLLRWEENKLEKIVCSDKFYIYLMIILVFI